MNNQIKAAYVDHMGDDLSVVNAARVSFAKESEWEWEECGAKAFGNESYQRLSDRDAKLIKYLAKHKHFSPFGHAFASFHVKAPLFVHAQLEKHEYLRGNTISRRYVDDIPEFYVPEVWRGRAENAKQGSSDEGVDNLPKVGRYGEFDYEDICGLSLALYEQYIEAGVAPEQARMVLPQATMTEMRWSGSMDAFAKMCNLRCATDTQYETRLVAHDISNKMHELFPVSWEALMND
tara:strand:+ start:423 stop:1127 length:705 start_codon:yes stop_codon:yes gene_type:complete